jgi:hypothetical protein
MASAAAVSIPAAEPRFETHDLVIEGVMETVARRAQA